MWCLIDARFVGFFFFFVNYSFFCIHRDYLCKPPDSAMVAWFFRWPLLFQRLLCTRSQSEITWLLKSQRPQRWSCPTPFHRWWNGMKEIGWLGLCLLLANLELEPGSVSFNPMISFFPSLKLSLYFDIVVYLHAVVRNSSYPLYPSPSSPQW